MLIFVDESGDLGYSFEQPNQQGGSSRYMTIAGIVMPEQNQKHFSRCIADLYRKYNLSPKIEKKGANFSDEHATYIINALKHVFTRSEQIKAISITVRKENVYLPLRKEKNIFYNYMLRVLLPETLKQMQSAQIILDKRTIKVHSGNSFPDYIKAIMWGDMNHDIEIDCSYDSSDLNQGIWIADWLANFIWRHYETGRSDAYAELSKLSGKQFFDNRLFF